jgi:transposase, IS5 family
MSFTDAEYGIKRMQTRREIFLAEMDRVVPWKEIEGLIEPDYPKASNGRRPYELSAMIRIHFMQQWYGLSDPAMEEALYEIASMRRFAGLSLAKGAVPDETTILNFRHLLGKHGLTALIFEAVNSYLASRGLRLSKGTIVDATIIAARALRRTPRVPGILRCIRPKRATSGTLA